MKWNSLVILYVLISRLLTINTRERGAEDENGKRLDVDTNAKFLQQHSST
jgi:hypothetical protein